jgi:DMSO/TMAO reductase YedYZ molybdopterin-dependent catalytic subunit
MRSGVRLAPCPGGTVPSRRRFLARAASLAGLGLAPHQAWAGWLAQAECDGGPAGELVRTLPLHGPGAVETPLGQMLGGSGLDARLFTDLTTLAPGRMVTAARDMFVRTAVPPGLDHDPARWRILLRRDAATSAVAVTAAALAAKARAQGAHLIECAGNSNPQNFGLMSAVEWDGVPLADVLAAVPPPPDATGVLVSGIDDTSRASLRSQPGASWVLPRAAIAGTGAFLATRMNGAPMTPDHGAPVRLVVPGWYGCAWIKWVNEVRWVGADEPATSQMIEFAGRTHQDGRPALARDYEAPAIDTSAMPIRVEQRRVNGKTEYHIVGIVWGGSTPVDQLVIRFGSRDRGTPVRVCPAPTTTRTWALWTHRWRPADPGPYDISLRTADTTVRTRRLDLSFYIRRVSIDEI